MANKPHNVFAQLQVFESEISRLEGKILELELKLEKLMDIERNHMIRIKNGEEMSDDFLYSGRAYQDLSPEKAFKLYNNKDFDFILLDVSSKSYKPIKNLPEAIRIPWEEFTNRFHEIQSKTTPIFVISEDGVNSVLACEYLVKFGYYNCNNISGGYKYWKGRLEEVRTA